MFRNEFDCCPSSLLLRRNSLSFMPEFNSLDEAVRLMNILHRCEEGIEPSYRASFLLRNSPVALPAYARVCYRQGNVSYAARLARKHFEETQTEEALFERLFYCYARSCRTLERNVSMSTRRRMVALRNACVRRFLQIENLPHVSAFLLELYLRGEIPQISRKQFTNGMLAFFHGFYAESQFPEASAFAPLRPPPSDFPIPKLEAFIDIAILLFELNDTGWVTLSTDEYTIVRNLCSYRDKKFTLPDFNQEKISSSTNKTFERTRRIKLRILLFKVFFSKKNN